MAKTVVNPKTVSGRPVSWWVQDSETMQMVALNNKKLVAEKLRIQKQREEFERACRENP
jgi:hypothetical protein